jgi:hypothetical protein
MLTTQLTSSLIKSKILFISSVTLEFVVSVFGANQKPSCTLAFSSISIIAGDALLKKLIIPAREHLRNFHRVKIKRSDSISFGGNYTAQLILRTIFVGRSLNPTCL